MKLSSPWCACMFANSSKYATKYCCKSRETLILRYVEAEVGVRRRWTTSRWMEYKYSINVWHEQQQHDWAIHLTDNLATLWSVCNSELKLVSLGGAGFLFFFSILFSVPAHAPCKLLTLSGSWLECSAKMSSHKVCTNFPCFKWGSVCSVWTTIWWMSILCNIEDLTRDWIDERGKIESLFTRFVCQIIRRIASPMAPLYAAAAIAAFCQFVQIFCERDRCRSA